MDRRSLLLTTAIVCSVLSAAQADSWPQLRGATGSGVSKETGLPAKWSANQNVVWKTDLDGQANSSPAVNDKYVVLTNQQKDDSLWVIVLNRKTGKTIQTVKVGAGKLAAKGPANLYTHRHNAATPTAIVEGNRVWAFFGTGLLVCLDAVSGKVQWEKDLVKEYGKYDITFGMGSSPRLWGDLLYVSCMTKGPSYVVALDKNSGDEKWKVARRLPAEFDGPDAYSTPVVDQSLNRNLLLVSGSDHVNAYQLSNGRQEWISNGLTIDSHYGRVIASPVASEEGIVIATSANPGGGGLGRVIAVDARGRGNRSSNRLWTHPKSSPDSSTPVVVNGLVFMTTDKGIVTCINVKTGKQLYQKRIGQGPYHASLVSGDGKVYFLSATGTCTVIRSDDSGEILAENKLPGTFYATPAISDGVIFLRAYEGIYAIGS